MYSGKYWCFSAEEVALRYADRKLQGERKPPRSPAASKSEFQQKPSAHLCRTVYFCCTGNRHQTGADAVFGSLTVSHSSPRWVTAGRKHPWAASITPIATRAADLFIALVCRGKIKSKHQVYDPLSQPLSVCRIFHLKNRPIYNVFISVTKSLVFPTIGHMTAVTQTVPLWSIFTIFLPIFLTYLLRCWTAFIRVTQK